MHRLQSQIAFVGLSTLGVLATESAAAQVSASWSGRLYGSVVETMAGGHAWYLQASDGNSYRLDVTSGQMVPLGTPDQAHGSEVSVSGVLATVSPGQSGAIRVSSIVRTGGANLMARSQESGSLPFLVLTCEYADKAGVPAVSTSFWPTLLGSTAPSLDHYFREVSAGAVNMLGSALGGTYALPNAESAYAPSGNLNLLQLLTDCKAAADPSTNFAPFDGIILQVNGSLGTAAGMAFLGPLQVTVDGVQRSLRVAALFGGPNRSPSQAIAAHEIGHTLGWPHSAGTPGAQGYPYDSQWDVMSFGQTFFGPTSPGQADGLNWWWAAVHPIALRKWQEGWLSPARVFRPAVGTATLVTFDRSALPSGSPSYLMAIVPDPANPRAFYTVELRQFAGYDQPPRCVGGSCSGTAGLPGEGILIMRVDSTLSYPTVFANVVDADRNGNVNDAGAVWVAGEEFTDGFGTRIRVESVGASTASVTISTGVPLVTITTATLTEAVIGQSYQRQLAATGGTGVFTWSMQAGSTLPAGLSLSPTGLLSGTPSSATIATFTVVATSGGQMATRQFSLTVAPVLTITTSATLPSGVTGTPYSVQLVATGGSGSNSWSISDGSTLPPGLSLSSGGLLSGTPSLSTLGSHTIGVTNGGQTATRQFTLRVDLPVTIVTSSPLPSAGQGVAYNQTLQATGGTGSYSWATQAGSNLPAGLSLSAAGVLSGTPTTTGTFGFTLQVLSGGQTVNRLYSLTVVPPLTITTNAQLPDGIQGVPYSLSLIAGGGTGSYVWSSGSLPPGMLLSPGGLLSGTPSTGSGYGFPMTVTSGGQSVTQSFVITILSPVAITTPSSLPSGTQGVAYGQSLVATGGTGTFVWTVQAGSSLPSGLSLNATGLLSGTPASSGNFNFTLQVASGGQTATRAYALTVTQTLAITTAPSLPSATVGAGFSLSLAAAGGSGGYAWSVAPGSAMPPGLVVNAAGTISGTPISSGAFTFTIEVTSAGQTATRAFTLDVIGLLAITTPSPLSPATVGVPFTQSFVATGGSGPYTWSLQAGSVLPNGLALSAAGVLSGTPTTSGGFSFTLQVSSSGQTVTRLYALTVNASLAITTPSALPNGAQGVAYSQTLVATGGSAGYTWAVQSGSTLPTWMSLSPSGVLSGTPTSGGQFAFTVQVTSAGQSATRAFTLVVDASSVLTITTPSPLPSATRGVAYHQDFVASGGTGGYIWRLQAGSTLPAGLTLSGSGGLSGTPMATGSITFTVQVSSAGQNATRVFLLVIVDASVTITTPSALPSATVGVAYSHAFSATGGTGTYTWSLQTSSALPAGLSVSTAGVLGGTPSAVGDFGFTLQAASGGQTATRSFAMVVNPVTGLFRLSVTVTGSGSGAVLSPSAGVSCAHTSGGEVSGTCAVDLSPGTLVMLTASPASGSIFLGWTGACAGMTCQVEMSQARAVTSTFANAQGLVNTLVAALLGGPPVGATTAASIDALGNGNGALDVGDLVALLDRLPGVTLAPEVLMRLLGGAPDGIEH